MKVNRCFVGGNTTAMLRRLLAAFALVSFVSAAGVASAAPKKSETATTAPVSEVININTATEKQLAYLPGIGPSKAAKIIAYRLKRRFKRIRHLARVRGIGLKTVRRLKRWITIKGETTLSGPVKAHKK